MDELHWMDRIIAEQEAANGPLVTALIRSAAKAEEVLGIEALDNSTVRKKDQRTTKKL